MSEITRLRSYSAQRLQMILKLRRWSVLLGLIGLLSIVVGAYFELNLFPVHHLFSRDESGLSNPHNAHHVIDFFVLVSLITSYCLYFVYSHALAGRSLVSEHSSKNQVIAYFNRLEPRVRAVLRKKLAT